MKNIDTDLIVMILSGATMLIFIISLLGLALIGRTILG